MPKRKRNDIEWIVEVETGRGTGGNQIFRRSFTSKAKMVEKLLQLVDFHADDHTITIYSEDKQ
jgi:hypothetical protein